MHHMLDKNTNSYFTYIIVRAIKLSRTISIFFWPTLSYIAFSACEEYIHGRYKFEELYAARHSFE